MNELVQGARGLILASHHDVLLKRVCTRGLVLDHGRCAFLGPLNEALAHYHEKIRSSRKDGPDNKIAHRPAPQKVASGRLRHGIRVTNLVAGRIAGRAAWG